MDLSEMLAELGNPGKRSTQSSVPKNDREEDRDMERAENRERVSTGTWLGTGIIGGIVAGIAMAMVAMVWMLLAGQGFWRPMDVIASILLGEDTINPGFQMVPELVGMAIHMMLSAVFGLVFAFVVAHTSWSSGAIVGAATAYGLLLWIVNVVIIDANFIPAGLSLAPTPLMIVVHLVYGLVLGLVLAPELSGGR
jgi:tetrahydromethanopterin S-methyltransferase subunit G